MHETPKKSIQNANKTSSSSHLDPGIYQICKVRYESPEDIKTVIGLTVEIGKAANGGSTKFVPISIIPTAMIVKKSRILGQQNIFSAGGICQNQKK